MATEIKVPVLPESVADATIAKWYKKPGDTVKRDENLVDIETDKVMLEVPAPADGVLENIVKKEGATVKGGEVIGSLKTSDAATEKTVTANGSITKKTTAEKSSEPEKSHTEEESTELSPSVRRMISANELDAKKIK